MSYTALAGLAGQIGAPIIRDVLARKIGGGNAEIVGQIIDVVAREAGVETGALEGLAQSDPETVMEALVNSDQTASELVSVYMAELEAKSRMFAVEDKGPFLAWAWRPLGMYVVFGLWLWNFIILHVANAIWKIALPPMETGALIQLSALYLSLYMGGHTVKQVASSWRGSARA